MKKIGFTTSIPVEVIFAAGLIPVDLNNVFITSANPGRYIEKAENAGFPRSTCAWIKGIYSAILDKGDIDKVVGVVEGDCSNTRALIEVLELSGIRSIPFSYPGSKSYAELKKEIIKLCDAFNVTMEDCIRVKRELDQIREGLCYIDELTWKHNKATSMENHIWQVSSSDFNGCFKSFRSEMLEKIAEIERRKAEEGYIRLGYIGVPPINSDLYDFIEGLNARVVFNEVQRQFTMAHGIGNDDIVEVYRQFTYPYNLSNRLLDIKNQIPLRKIDGIIHCTQAFCFRGIEDIVIRRQMPEIPILTFECDRPGPLDARTRLRIEAFVDMISP